MYKKDQITEKNQKKNAIEFVQRWIESELHDFIEPVRLGVPKGEVIGFSENKEKATYFMVLYPDSMNLSGIAKLAGVSPGVLGVWESQKDFKLAVTQKRERLGQTIKNIVENYLISWEKEKANEPLQLAFNAIDRLAFFNPAVSVPLLEMVIHKIQSGSLEYASIAFRCCSWLIRPVVGRGKMKPNVQILIWKRIAIEKCLDQLINPETLKKCGREKIQEVVRLLKREIAILSFIVMAPRGNE
jgi:hypothetical protein